MTIVAVKPKSRSSISRKGYKLIADAILLVNQTHGERDDNDYIWFVADAIATSLAMDNPRFDRKKFMEACGLTL